jgi:PAS domain S-box-containing protein
VHSTPILNRAGDILGVLSVHFAECRRPSQLEIQLADLCARNAAEAIEAAKAQSALRESESLYRQVVDAMPVAVYSTDASGRILVYNRAAVALWQREPEIGQELWCGSHRMYWPDGTALPLNECPMAIAIQHGESLTGVEAVVERPDGTRRNVLAHPRMMRDSRGQIVGAINVLVDITERKDAERMQDRLHEAQRLESVGLLAGGIAHDFNNILVGVLGNASIAADMVGFSSPVHPVLKEIEIAAERAAHLTRQMLAYAGKTHFVIEPVVVPELIRETASLVRASIPKNIMVHMDLPSGLPAIQADRSQMQQVVMNLLINAAEAIGERAGVIAVATSLRRIEADGDTPAGWYMCLEVRDSGCGMNEDTRARIFDPFFTTKFTGRGLGLAAVAGVVRGHKGVVRVKSAPDQGSTFTVLIPVEKPPAMVRDEERATLGTVLVVDDEAVVLRTAKLGLERRGYRVLAAESGPEAIGHIERDGARIDLVLLDVSMPVMSGPEVLRELVKRRPGIPVLVSSGYPEGDVFRQFGGERVSGFIQKPYTPARLSEKIASILNFTPSEKPGPVPA